MERPMVLLEALHKALVLYRESFVEAITLMIYGQRFRKVAKNVCLR